MAVALDTSSSRIRATNEERIVCIENLLHFARAPADFSEEELKEEILLTEVDIRLNENLLWDKAVDALEAPRHLTKIGRGVYAVDQFAKMLDLTEDEIFKLLTEMTKLRDECVKEAEKQHSKKALLEKIDEEYGVHLRTFFTIPSLEATIAEMQARLPLLEKQIQDATEKRENITPDILAISSKLNKGTGNKSRLKASLETKKSERTKVDATIQKLEAEKKKLESDISANSRSLLLTKGDVGIFLRSYQEKQKKIVDEIECCQTNIDRMTLRVEVIRAKFQANVRSDNRILELRARRASLEKEQEKRV